MSIVNKVTFEQQLKDLTIEQIESERVLHHTNYTDMSVRQLRRVLFLLNDNVKIRVTNDLIYQLLIHFKIVIPEFTYVRSTLMNKYKFNRSEADKLLYYIRKKRGVTNE